VHSMEAAARTLNNEAGKENSPLVTMGATSGTGPRANLHSA
jgi:hypothetical protein